MKVRLDRPAFIGRTYRPAGSVVEVGIAKDKLPEWMKPVGGRPPAEPKQQAKDEG